jgi:HD-like signal output (HDOD) protein
MPEIAREAINSSRFGHEAIFKAEQRLLGFNHADLGATLIKAWRLPSSLAETVQYHHTPSTSVEFPVEVAIVHIADIIVSSAQLGHAGDPHVPPIVPEAWTLLGIELTDIPELLNDINEQLDALTNILVA